MELRAYLQIVIAKWWLVLSTFLITFGAVLEFTIRQVPAYQSVAT